MGFFNFGRREKVLGVPPERIPDAKLRDGLHFPNENPVFAKPIPPRREQGSIEAADNDGIVDLWSQEVPTQGMNVSRFFRGLFN